MLQTYFACLVDTLNFRIIKMSSPHFNTVTAIGGFFCYVHVLLGAFKQSRVSAEEAMCLCKVGKRFMCRLSEDRYWRDAIKKNEVLSFCFFFTDKDVSNCHRFYLCVWRNVCQNLASVQDIYKQASRERSMGYNSDRNISL